MTTSAPADTRPRNGSRHYDKDDLRPLAAGRWPQVLASVAGIDSALLDGKGRPCPKCGGKDRFRLIDEEAGAVLCNQCFSENNGDGFAAVEWMRGVSFSEAVDLVGNYLGASGAQPGKKGSSASTDKPVSSKAYRLDLFEPIGSSPNNENKIREIFCSHENFHGVTPESLEAFGAIRGRVRFKDGCPQNHVFAIPAFDGKLEKEVNRKCLPASGEFFNGEKKMNMAGGRDGWIVAGKDQDGAPVRGKDAIAKCSTIWIVEGESDALALWNHLPEGYAVATSTCGSEPRAKLACEFVRGKVVVVAPDCDKTGQAGAIALARNAADRYGADSVYLASLPYEIKPSHGEDVRDFLARDGKSFEDLLDFVKPFNPAEETGDYESDPFEVKTSSDLASEVAEALESFNDHKIDQETFLNRLHELSRIETLSVCVTLAGLLEQYPDLRETIVDGLIRRGEVANIIGATKIGKSWLVFGLALCVARGLPWLNHFEVKTGRVLIVDYELHLETLSYRMRKTTRDYGIEQKDVEGIRLLSLRGSKTDIFGLKSLISRLNEEFDLIILDPVYRLLPKGTSENDNAQMMEFYSLLDNIAEELNAAIVCIHHSSKGFQNDKRVTDVGSGAGSQSRAADTHIVLREHSKNDFAVMEASLRSFPPIDPLTLAYEFPCWSVRSEIAPELKQAPSAFEAKQRRRDEEGKDLILEALKRAGCQIGSGLSRTKLRTETGMSLDRLNRLIADLRNEDRIDLRVEENHQGKEVEYFRLAEEGSSAGQNSGQEGGSDDSL